MIKLFYKIILLLLLITSATVLYQKHTYAYHTLIRIDPLPQTNILMAQEQYVEAYHYLNYFMQFDYMKNNRQAQQTLENITTMRSTLSYKSSKILEGIRTGTSDELIGQASALGSDFFLIGDIRDLTLEGTHYYKDEEVDTVLVALSTIGLVASASTFFTLGSSAVVKSGVSLLKLAQKSKCMPTWLVSYLTKHTKQIRHTRNLDSIKPLFSTLDTIHKQVGLNDTLKILSHTHNLKELKNTAKLSKRYKQKTATLLKLSNKKILTHAKKLNHSDIKTIELASTFGTSGFVHLIKGGEKRFIKTTKRMKGFSKVGYKGELWNMLLWIMKNVSDTILIILMFISSLLLLPLKRLVSITGFRPKQF